MEDGGYGDASPTAGERVFDRDFRELLARRAGPAMQPTVAADRDHELMVWSPRDGLLYTADNDGDIRADDAYRNGGFGSVAALSEAIACLPETTMGEAREKECGVCLESFEMVDKLRKMPCSHAFHESCIFQWLRVSRLCPYCRFALPAEKEIDDDEEEEDDGNYTGRLPDEIYGRPERLEPATAQGFLPHLIYRRSESAAATERLPDEIHGRLEPATAQGFLPHLIYRRSESAAATERLPDETHGRLEPATAQGFLPHLIYRRSESAAATERLPDGEEEEHARLRPSLA